MNLAKLVFGNTFKRIIKSLKKKLTILSIEEHNEKISCFITVLLWFQYNAIQIFLLSRKNSFMF